MASFDANNTQFLYEASATRRTGDCCEPRPREIVPTHLGGRELTKHERQKKAREMGVCAKCYAVRTHTARRCLLLFRKLRPIKRPSEENGGDVFEGVCIPCNRNTALLPESVVSEWKARHAQQHDVSRINSTDLATTVQQQRARSAFGYNYREQWAVADVGQEENNEEEEIVVPSERERREHQLSRQEKLCGLDQNYRMLSRYASDESQVSRDWTKERRRQQEYQYQHQQQCQHQQQDRYQQQSSATPTSTTSARHNYDCDDYHQHQQQGRKAAARMVIPTPLADKEQLARERRRKRSVVPYENGTAGRGSNRNSYVNSLPSMTP